MRVHHLIAGLMRPAGLGTFISHVLLVETPAGLVLVDSGFGRDDLAHLGRLGVAPRALNLALDDQYTAAGGVERLGFDPAEVKHIVLTHLDFDHVGGVGDFPKAVVHTTAEEWRAATSDSHLLDRPRYFPVQWKKAAEMRQHEGAGEAWRNGLSGHRIVDGVTLVPLAGHTRGHAAVAVDSGDGLIVHAGDAIFDGSSIGASVDGTALSPRWPLRALERVAARQPAKINANHRILRELDAAADVTVISAHDPRFFPGELPA